MPREIVLARHGETEWSRDGRHTGRTDIPLTDTGADRPSCCAARSSSGASRACCRARSQRALETCRLAGLGDAAETTEDLLEWDYGEYEGITTAADPRAASGLVPVARRLPGGEQAADVGRRVDRVIAAVEGTDGDVALFAHGHVLRVLAARWLGLGPESGALLALGTGTLSVLGYERETRVVKRWNSPVPGAGTTAPMSATTGTNSPTMPASLRPLRKQTIASAMPIS